MKANLDFSNVEDSFEVIPEGSYLCFLFDVDLKQTKKGDDMYVLTLKVAEGDSKGRQLFYNLPVMPQTMWKIKETLEAFDVEVPKSVVNIDFDELLGKKCRVTVGHREWQGKEYEDVQGLTHASITDDPAFKDEEVPF